MSELEGRCYGCCQENCGYSRCGCDCHGKTHPYIQVGLKVIAKCKNHSRYRGKGKPKLPCEQCWRIWFAGKGELF